MGCGGHRSPASRRFPEPAASGRSAWNSALDKRTFTRPGGGLKQPRNEFGPIEWALRAARKTPPGGVGLRCMRATQAGGNCCLGVDADKAVQSPTGLLQSVAAERAHVCLQCGIFIEACGGVAGGEQPVEFVLGKRGGEPAQQQMSAPGKRDLAERHSERELEERDLRLGRCA